MVVRTVPILTSSIFAKWLREMLGGEDFFFFFYGSTTVVGQGLPVPTCGLGFQ